MIYVSLFVAIMQTQPVTDLVLGTFLNNCIWYWLIFCFFSLVFELIYCTTLWNVRNAWYSRTSLDINCLPLSLMYNSCLSVFSGSSEPDGSDQHRHSSEGRPQHSSAREWLQWSDTSAAADTNTQHCSQYTIQVNSAITLSLYNAIHLNDDSVDNCTCWH